MVNIRMNVVKCHVENEVNMKVTDQFCADEMNWKLTALLRQPQYLTNILLLKSTYSRKLIDGPT